MIELRFDLFKPSGKWAYGGVVSISGKHPIWDTDALLAEIEANQTEVIDGTITDRHYHLVIHETESQADDSEYSGFYTHMFLAVPR